MDLTIVRGERIFEPMAQPTYDAHQIAEAIGKSVRWVQFLAPRQQWGQIVRGRYQFTEADLKKFLAFTKDSRPGRPRTRRPSTVGPSNPSDWDSHPPGGLTQPDTELGAIVGNEPLPRIEVPKRIWAYIKENNLQDTKDKRTINTDNKLKAIFDGREKVSMLEMPELFNRHLR